jgi:FkbM family methyltransferase
LGPDIPLTSYQGPSAPTALARGGRTSGVVAVTARLVALYLRHFPLSRGKLAVWNRIVRPYFIWRSIDLTARTRFGAKFAVRFPDLIQVYIFFFGVWEPRLSRFLLGRLKKGDVFVDVGANIGYYALLASRRVGPSGKVYAIEAAPSIFAMLERNLEVNRAGNVVSFNMAVTDSAKDVPIYLHSEANLSATTTIPYLAENRGAELVATVQGARLDEIVGSEALRSARIIKIDIEGAEWEVVRSLRDVLPTLSMETEIVIEAHEGAIRQSGGTAEAFLQIFADAGFSPFVIPNEYGVPFYIADVPESDFLPLRDGSFGQIDLLFRRVGPAAGASAAR